MNYMHSRTLNEMALTTSNQIFTVKYFCRKCSEMTLESFMGLFKADRGRRKYMATAAADRALRRNSLQTKLAPALI